MLRCWDVKAINMGEKVSLDLNDLSYSQMVQDEM